MSKGAAPRLSIGILGGTFDPVHHGHLRSAVELLEHLGLDELRLMPSATPPHRGTPGCTAQQRVHMTELALAGENGLSCERLELDREGPSYTIDSLVELRHQLGPETSLALVMGCDALLTLPSWHRWESLLDYAHIVVMARPGWTLPTSGPVAKWLADNRCAEATALKQAAHGRVLVEQMRPLPISSSEIRSLLAQGRSVRFLLPVRVLDYIEAHKLYEG